MYIERHHRHAHRHHGRNHNHLSAGTPIDWAGILQGTVAPTVNFNFLLDKDTKKTLYLVAGGLGIAILGAALVRRR